MHFANKMLMEKMSDIWIFDIHAYQRLCSYDVAGVPNLWLMSHLGSFWLFGWLSLILANFDTLLGAIFTGPNHPCTRYIRHMYSVYKFIVLGACIVYVCVELSSCGIHRAQRLSPCCLHAPRSADLVWLIFEMAHVREKVGHPWSR